MRAGSSVASLLALFALVQTAMSQITVLTPNGGEQFRRFDSVRASWTGSADGAAVRVEVVDSNGVADAVNYSTTESSTTFPAYRLPAGPYRLRITTLRQDTAALMFQAGEQTGQIRISPDGRELAYPHTDGVVRFRDMYTGEWLREIRIVPSDTLLHRFARGSLKYSADGARLLVNYPKESGDTLSVVLDLPSRTVVWSATATPASDISHDGSSVAVGNVIRDLATGDTLSLIGYPNDIPASVFLSPDMQLAASHTATKVQLWSVRTGRIVYTWYPQFTTKILSLHFNPDGRSLFATEWSGSVHMWDLATGAYRWLGYMGVNRFLAFSRDGKRFAAGGVSNNVGMYDSRTGALIRQWSGGGRYLTSGDFSSDDERVATCNEGGEVRIVRFEARLDSYDSDATWLVLPVRVSIGSHADFGRVVAPSNRDSIRSVVLSHSEPTPPQWTSMRIEGRDSRSFGTRGPFEFPIALDAPQRITVLFRPLREGDHEAALVLSFGPDTLRFPLRGIGVRQQVQRVAAVIDFGERLAGRSGDTVVGAIVRNVDSVRHSVDVRLVDAGEFSEFAIIEGAGESMLEAGQALNVHMRYTAAPRNGESKGKLEVSYAGDGSPFTIALTGRSTGEPSAIESTGLPAHPVELIASSQHSARVLLPPGAHEVMLINALGEVRYAGTYEGARTIDVDLSSLPNGYYLLVVKGPSGRNGEHMVRPLIVTKR